MNFTRNGNLVEIDGKFRVEAGPGVMQGVATVKLLDDNVTADHYAVGRFDRLGEEIEIGKTMDYYDWNGFQRDGVSAFHAYALGDKTEAELEDADLDHPDTELTIWREIGVYDTEEEAISACLSTAA